MSDVALGLASLVPAISLGISGIALVPTRSRPAGLLLAAGSAGVIASFALRVAGADDAARLVLTASIGLPAPMAVLAYPRAGIAHAVDYCSWVVVVGAGLLAVATATAFSEETITLASVVALTLIAHSWWVAETGGEADREAVLWLALAVGTSGLVLAIGGMALGNAGVLVGVVLLAVVGPAMVVGVRRPGLADVRSLVVEAVVVSVVVLAYLSVYIGVLGAFGLVDSAAPTEAAYALLGAALALGFRPLQVVLRGLVDELLFGDRPDPLEAAAAVADRIGDDPVMALRAIREGLVLPYASLSADGVELATSGTAVTDTRRFPLSLGTGSMGQLVVGLRPGDLNLSSGDTRVLQIVGPLLAQTLRARALSEELKASRGTAIAAIEEERRRLRRDLHDGLGPTLSGIALTADAARNTIRTDPNGADELLQRLRADAATAVGDVRRLVYDMRPPVLDQLGLVPALRQQLASVHTPCGRQVQVSIEVPTDLPQLPAAVEVACYRIATEAVTNAARHSGTDRASVRIAIENDDLTVSVDDPGTASEPWTPGVGLASMHERATELGGTLHIEHTVQGSAVRAKLPLP